MSKRPQYRLAGFTLVELLVVIGILVILMGILFPAVIAIRKRARRVASQAQLNGIANAANVYYMDHKAYPGYFSNKDVGDPGMASKWTGTENLVLSLMGQVSLGGGGGTISISSPSNISITIDEDKIGSGPITRQGRVYGSYYSPQEGELGVIEGQLSPNKMPELLDRHTGVPILYFRANKGYTTPVGPTGAPQYAYSRRAANGYVWATALKTAKGRTYNEQRDSLLSNSNSADNLAMLAINPQLSRLTTGGSANHANDDDDVIQGAFMLVSPGVDGIYFDKRQNPEAGSNLIKDHSDLADFDDVVVHGGA